MTEQTVAKPDEAAQQASDENGAQDDLDSLLAEYDNSVETKPKAEVKSESQPDDPVRLYVERKMAEDADLEQKANREEVLKTVKDGMDIAIDDRFIWGFISTAAAEDPRLEKAFLGRKQNPAAWNKVVKTLQADMKSALSIDPGATADRQSVEAAIRGASNKAAPNDEPNLGTMSNADFETYKRGLLRKG